MFLDHELFGIEIATFFIEALQHVCFLRLVGLLWFCFVFVFELCISLACEFHSIKSLQNYTKSKAQIEMQENTVRRIIGKSLMSFFLIYIGQIKRVPPKTTW